MLAVNLVTKKNPTLFSFSNIPFYTTHPLAPSRWRKRGNPSEEVVERSESERRQ
jgi:hypothetical protein